MLGKQIKPPLIPKLDSLSQEIEIALKTNRQLKKMIAREETQDQFDLPRGVAALPLG